MLEDDDAKYEDIAQQLMEYGVDSMGIIRVQSVAGLYVLQRSLNAIDLCILDLYLPFRDGESPRDAVIDVLNVLDRSSLTSIPVLAITGRGSEMVDRISEFSRRGVFVYSYTEDEVWRSALGAILARAQERHRFDFIGMTALQEERLGYNTISTIKPKRVTVCGLSGWEVAVDGFLGCLICTPKMGLVDAAAATSKILATFSPSVIFMSGICAGVNDAELGQLLITDSVWEYQSGKWLDEVFMAEPYFVSIDERVKSYFSTLVEDGRGYARSLERDIPDLDRPGKVVAPRLAMIASGSAVIASSKRIESVKAQHRKVLGIDMELYGFHRAVVLSQRPVIHFSAKTVVDKADVAKDDNLHAYGSAVSARFCLDVLSHLLRIDTT